MSAYPESMRYFLDEVNGFSTNTFKLFPQNQDSATANRILRFTLPSNSLLNLRSFSLFFNMTTEGALAGGRLPAGIDRVVNRVEVTCGGVQLASGANYYNVLQQAKKALQGNDLNGQLGHPDVIRYIPTTRDEDVQEDPSGVPIGYGVDLANFYGANETYPDADGQTQFCIAKWDGFLGTCAPSILDSSLVPDIVISIFLDDDSILASVKAPYLHATGAGKVAGAATTEYDKGRVTEVSAAAAAGTPATWKMNNIHATIECIGLSDGVLDALEASIIAQEGSLRMPFKQYFAFQDTTADTMRFNVATQSLDRIWVAHRAENFTEGNRAGAVIVRGSKRAAIDNSGTQVTNANIATIQDARTVASQAGIAGFDSGGGNIVHTNKEEYLTKKFDLSEPPRNPAGPFQRYQFSLNGSYYPQFQATFEEMLQLSRNSVMGWREDHLSNWAQKRNFSAQCIRLCLPETGVRKISGFDTRSVSLNGYYNMYNVSAARTVNLFCECTSVLRIGSARQLEIVQ